MTEENLTIGWTRGRVSHAVIRAEDGTPFRACYYSYELRDDRLLPAPDPLRICRRPGCRAQFEAWLAASERLPVAALLRRAVVGGLAVAVILSFCWMRPVAADIPPASDVAAEPAFLAGLRAEGGHVAALDANGRIVARGKGSTTTLAIAVCPGAARFVEIGRRRERLVFAVRSLPSLSIIRQATLDIAGAPNSLSCGTPDADAVYASIPESKSAGGTVPDRIVRIERDGTLTGLWNGRADAVAFASTGSRVVVGLRQPTEGVLLDLDVSSEVIKEIGRLDRPPFALAISPDGSKVAAAVQGEDDNAWRIVVVPTAGGSAAHVQVDGPETPRTLVWSTPTVLTVERSSAGDGLRTVDTYDDGLRLVGHWAGWEGTPTAHRDGALFGVSSDGRLHRADTVKGTRTELDARVGPASVLVAVGQRDPQIAATLAAMGEPVLDEEVATPSPRRSRAPDLAIAGTVALSMLLPVVWILRRRRRRDMTSPTCADG